MEAELSLYFLKTVFDSITKDLINGFYQEEVENLAIFGGNHYHKFSVERPFMLNKSTKSEPTNKTH